MKLVWYPQRLSWLGQVQDAEIVKPPWTRMEKLTAAAVALGVVGTFWSIYTYVSKK